MRLAGAPVYVVEEQANPSTDYFVLPALAAPGRRVVRCGFGDLPAQADLTGATVVFVRYVPAPWALLVERARGQLAELVFFMDDDVLDTRASAGMPLRYRLKLARLSAWRAGWLRRQGAKLWVSCRHLHEKYAAWAPRIVLPVPLTLAHEKEFRRVFYHGSASHEAEIRWLRPVVEEVLSRDDRLIFEIVGGKDVNRLYRGLPRVNVVHPMKWPAYRAFLAMRGRHVGLAPLLDLPFNRARSYTKFFDITACGAVGIYSSACACAEVVNNGVEGVVLPLDRAAWVGAILQLAGDDALRQRLLESAKMRMTSFSPRARN